LEDKIVGVTNYCNYPEKANKIEKIGEMTPLNLEKIASLKPELIPVRGNSSLKRGRL